MCLKLVDNKSMVGGVKSVTWINESDKSAFLFSINEFVVQHVKIEADETLRDA